MKNNFFHSSHNTTFFSIIFKQFFLTFYYFNSSEVEVFFSFVGTKTYIFILLTIKQREEPKNKRKEHTKNWENNNNAKQFFIKVDDVLTALDLIDTFSAPSPSPTPPSPPWANFVGLEEEKGWIVEKCHAHTHEHTSTNNIRPIDREGTKWQLEMSD